jgi:tyrosine-protein phosphatase SIW14
MKRKLVLAVVLAVLLVLPALYFAWPLLTGESAWLEAGQPAPAQQGPKAQPQDPKAKRRPTTASQPLNVAGVPNLHRVSKVVYRGAQPSEEGFRQLKGMGIRTVVNLRHYHSSRWEAENANLAYEHIAIKGWHGTMGHVLRFLEIVGDKKRTPVFVYCNDGASRTGFLCAAYRVVVCGWSPKGAVAEMADERFGSEIEFKNLARRIEEMDVKKLRKALRLTQ